MAIDSPQKRWSMMNWGNTFSAGVYVFPDGSDLDSKGQRAAGMWLYSGIPFDDPSGFTRAVYVVGGGLPY